MVFEASIEELSQLRVTGSGRAELRAVLAGLGRVRGAADALEAEVLAAIDALVDHGVDAASTVRSAQRCSARVARRKALRARTLTQRPKATAALAAGRISAEHVDDLVRAATDTSPEQVDDSRLVPTEGSARPADLARRDVRDWVRARQAPADRHQAHLRRRAARELTMFVGDDEMVVIHGRFDPVAGAQLRATVDAEGDRLWRLDGGRDRADTVRSVVQRRADALHGLLCGAGTSPGHRADDAPRTPPPVRHQITVVASVDVVTGADPAGRCEIPGVGSIPPDELRRLACNSELVGILFDTHGEVLHHGRRRRSVTDPQWRTLIARDRGCVLCATGPSRCEAHHIIPWAVGGRTDIDNLALHCTTCHHRLHDHHQRLHPPDHSNPHWHTTTHRSRAP
ncbi:MAG: DUF222 domain-containing protein [Acidimicrobiales bacterium]